MRGPVAKRYARALLDLGVEKGKFAVFQKQLRDLADAYGGSPELRAILNNPGVSGAERRKVLETISQKAMFDPLLRNFAMILLDNDRFEYVEHIAEEFDALVDEHSGNVRATVTTAKELKDSQVAVIKGAIAKLTGKNVLLETEVDPEILGGVVTRVGNTLYDGSVRTQLETLKESILKEV